MPVAHRQETISDESQFIEQRLPKLLELDLDIFKEIKELAEKKQQYQIEEREELRKIEKLTKNFEAAEEVMNKAEKKYEALHSQNERLKGVVESSTERIHKASAYWKSYGLDVRQISDDEKDDFKHFEFIFTRLSKGRSEPSEGPNTDVSEEDGNKHIIGLKYQHKKLSIVSQEPEIFESSQLDQLSQKITAECINEDGLVDYRSAMVLIRRDLIKSRFS